MDFSNLLLILLFCLKVESSDDIFCGNPGQPLYSFYSPVKSFYRVNDTIEVKCEKKHHLLGNKTRTCTHNGVWSGEAPFCVKSESSNLLSKDQKNYDNFTRFTDGEQETCIPFNISSSNVLQIQLKNETRINKIIFLLKQAKNSTKLRLNILFTNSTVEQKNNFVNTCTKEKTNSLTKELLVNPKQGTGKFIKLENEGSPTCIKICELYLLKETPDVCGSPEIPVNGIMERTDSYQGSKYSCETDYHLVGSNTRICKNGKWGGQSPRCELNKERNNNNSVPEEYSSTSESSVAAVEPQISTVCITAIAGILGGVFFVFCCLGIAFIVFRKKSTSRQILSSEYSEATEEIMMNSEYASQPMVSPATQSDHSRDNYYEEMEDYSNRAKRSTSHCSEQTDHVYASPSYDHNGQYEFVEDYNLPNNSKPEVIIPEYSVPADDVQEEIPTYAVPYKTRRSNTS